MTKLHFNETLYAISKKGKIKIWTCQVKIDQSKVFLVVSNKTGDDSIPIFRSSEITEGKNIGKANETTILYQALFEAEARVNKKKKEGYKESRPADSAVANTNALGFLQPMLAKSILNNAKNITYPAFIQPKLDGHRALITRNNKGNIVMYSRKGNIIDTMQHIISEINHLPKGYYLDGELYQHGQLLQDTTSAIKKYRPGISEKIKYILYDCIISKDTGYLSRSTWLYKYYDNKKNIEIIKTLPIHDLNAAKNLTQKYIDSGYEGGIVRTSNLQYQPGVRSNQLTKIKFFTETEFKIIDITKDTSTSINNSIVEIIVLECTVPGGTFKVSAPGSFVEKEYFYKNRNKYIGKEIIVKHSGFTKDKKPIHPVALAIREDV